MDPSAEGKAGWSRPAATEGTQGHDQVHAGCIPRQQIPVDTEGKLRISPPPIPTPIPPKLLPPRDAPLGGGGIAEP